MNKSLQNTQPHYEQNCVTQKDLSMNKNGIIIYLTGTRIPIAIIRWYTVDSLLLRHTVMAQWKPPLGRNHMNVVNAVNLMPQPVSMLLSNIGRIMILSCKMTQKMILYNCFSGV